MNGTISVRVDLNWTFGAVTAAVPGTFSHRSAKAIERPLRAFSIKLFICVSFRAPVFCFSNCHNHYTIPTLLTHRGKNKAQPGPQREKFGSIPRRVVFAHSECRVFTTFAPYFSAEAGDQSALQRMARGNNFLRLLHTRHHRFARFRTQTPDIVHNTSTVCFSFRLFGELTIMSISRQPRIGSPPGCVGFSEPPNWYIKNFCAGDTWKLAISRPDRVINP